MKPYICNDPIKHDGEYWAVGDSLELDDKQAGPLLIAGVIHLDAAALPAAGSNVRKDRPKKELPQKPATDGQDANPIGGEQNSNADETSA
jgi:hypothetical protein